MVYNGYAYRKCLHRGGAAQFLTQPFVVGERVALLGGGGSTIVTGVVEAVTPMNTIVSLSLNGPRILAPNPLADCICSIVHMCAAA